MACVIMSLCALGLAGCDRGSGEHIVPTDVPAEVPALPAGAKKPITRDNIVINAYLVQLQNEELRRPQLEYMKQAAIRVERTRMLIYSIIRLLYALRYESERSVHFSPLQ